jgi:coenzyme F420 hydrogenase subunit beta
MKMSDLFFNKLESEVITPGFCVLCGSCSGFCDRIELDYDQARPVLVNPCVSGCSNCYDHCPMTTGFHSSRIFGNLPGDEILGPVTEIKAVRATDKDIRSSGQDGGAVTAILAAILERGKIDAAVVVERDQDWRPFPRIITSKEELLSTAGSKYSPSPNIEELGQVFRKLDVKSVAIVDVGCHIRGIRNLEFNLLYNAGFSPYSDLKIYTIGLFCSGSFERKNIFSLLRIDPATIKKMGIAKSKLTIESEEKVSKSIRDFEAAFLPSCPMCIDYGAELADISIGSIASPEGYSTVIVRNLMGWGMLRDAVQQGYVEEEATLVDIDEIKKSFSKKKLRANDNISDNIDAKKAIPGFIKS